MKRTTKLKALAITLIIVVPIVSFFVLIGPQFVISVTQTWGRVTPESTEINTVISVSNPTPVSRWMKKIEFAFYINDMKLATESSENVVEVKPMGKTDTSFTDYFNNSRIIDLWMTYLERDSFFDVKFDGNVTFSSPTREITLPISYETSAHQDLLELLNINKLTDIPIGPTAVTLRSLTWVWGEVTIAKSEINSVAEFINPSNISVTITSVNLAINMNGVKVVDNSTQLTSSLLAHEKTNMSLTWTLNNALLNEWWPAYLQNDQTAIVDFQLQGTAKVVGTEYTFTVAEEEQTAYIPVLGDTTDFGFYVPVV